MKRPDTLSNEEAAIYKGNGKEVEGENRRERKRKAKEGDEVGVE